jgi:hypothetical protein
VRRYGWLSSSGGILAFVQFIFVGRCQFAPHVGEGEGRHPLLRRLTALEWIVLYYLTFTALCVISMQQRAQLACCSTVRCSADRTCVPSSCDRATAAPNGAVLCCAARARSQYPPFDLYCIHTGQWDGKVRINT